MTKCPQCSGKKKVYADWTANEALMPCPCCAYAEQRYQEGIMQAVEMLEAYTDTYGDYPEYADICGTVHRFAEKLRQHSQEGER